MPQKIELKIRGYCYVKVGKLDESTHCWFHIKKEAHKGSLDAYGMPREL